jgi:hypothetical protein
MPRAERSYRRPPRPFLARLRDADRLALLRPELFRPELFRPPREDRLALFRADPRPPRLADRPPRPADFRALFLAPFRADFLLRRAELRVDFFRDPLRERVREPVLGLRLGAGSSKSKDGDEAGVGEGVLSEGSGSIQPEPDQPISI